MTRRTAKVLWAVFALLVLSANALIPTHDLLASNPTITDHQFCDLVAEPTCPTRQKICTGFNPRAIVCDASNGSPDEGVCRDEWAVKCADFGVITCGVQYYCSGAATTVPPTQCVENANACQSTF